MEIGDTVDVGLTITGYFFLPRGNWYSNAAIGPHVRLRFGAFTIHAESLASLGLNPGDDVFATEVLPLRIGVGVTW